MTSPTGNDLANGADRSGHVPSQSVNRWHNFARSRQRAAARWHPQRAASGSNVPGAECYHATRLHFSDGTKMGSEPRSEHQAVPQPWQAMAGDFAAKK
jgi:hypothetical protein